MRLGRFLTMIVFAVSILFAQYTDERQSRRTPNRERQQSQENTEQDTIRFRRMPLQERGPAVSSPEVEIAPNGERVSPYPPYYRPDPS